MIQRYPSGFRFPGGESFVEMQARMTGTLARLVAAHPGRTVVAVSHADPIKTAVAHALGTHLDLFQRIAIFTASVTAIAYGPSGPTVLAVNATRGDLAPLAGSGWDAPSSPVGVTRRGVSMRRVGACRNCPGHRPTAVDDLGGHRPPRAEGRPRAKRPNPDPVAGRVDEWKADASAQATLPVGGRRGGGGRACR